MHGCPPDEVERSARYLGRREQVLAAGTQLLKIGDLDSVRIEADILSEEVGLVREKAPVEIFGPAVGDRIVVGEVERIFPSGFDLLLKRFSLIRNFRTLSPRNSSRSLSSLISFGCSFLAARVLIAVFRSGLFFRLTPNLSSSASKFSDE